MKCAGGLLSRSLPCSLLLTASVYGNIPRGPWRAGLDLNAGVNTLTMTANHPSGLFTTVSGKGRTPLILDQLALNLNGELSTEGDQAARST